MTYTVPSSVTYMHNKVPRLDVTTGFKAVTNSFGPDVLGTNKPYGEGVLTVAGAYFAIGITAFIIFLTVYSFSCCCRAKTRRFGSRGCCAIFFSVLFSPRIWYFLASLALLGGTSAALAQVSAFKKSVTDTVSALNNIEALLDGASSTVSVNLMPAMASVNSSIGELAAADSSWPASAQQAITALQLAAASGISSLASVDTQLAALTKSLDNTVHQGSSSPLDLDLLGQRVFEGGVIALAVFLGFVFFSLFGLCGNKRGACFFRWFDACGLVLATLLVFIFAGFFALIAIVGSDVCVDPNAAVQSVVNFTSSGSLAGATVIYYTTCGAAPYEPVTGAYADVVSAQGSVASSLAGVADLTASLDGAGGPGSSAAQPWLGYVTGNLTAANVSLTGVVNDVSCAPVSAQYNNIVDALCSTGVVAAIMTWGLATAAVVLVFILVSAGARLCWSHPGDPLDAQDEKAAMEAKGVVYAPPVGGQQQQAVGAAPQVANGGYAEPQMAPSGAAYSYA